MALSRVLPAHHIDQADAAQAMFNRQLATYRKITRENLMYHREVYDLLEKVLVEQTPKIFRFLDIACGDASVSAPMLKSTAIGHYAGIDISAHSLALAEEALKTLPCPVDLYCRDFAAALANWSEPVDVVWVGMSLHHLQTADKQRFVESVYRALGGAGLFLIWEPVYLAGEDRMGWLDRFSSYRTTWAALTDDEFAEMENHMRLADFPESADEWKAMGHRAGFAYVEELFIMPNRLGRMFKYWN